MTTIDVTDWTTTRSITTGDSEPIVESKRRIHVNSSTFAAMPVEGLLDFAEALRRSGISSRAIIRAIVRDHLWFRLVQEDGDGAWSRHFDPALVRWHLDDRAALIAERDRLSVGLEERGIPANGDDGEASPVDVALFWITEHAARAAEWQDVAGAGQLSGAAIAAWSELLSEAQRERDAALAQVAAMREVVEAADEFVDHLDRDGSRFSTLTLAVDAWRSGQTAQETAPAWPWNQEPAADGLGEGQGSAGGVGGATGGCRHTDHDLFTNKPLRCRKDAGHGGLHAMVFAEEADRGCD